MPSSLARALEFLLPRRRRKFQHSQTEPGDRQEVSEYEGALLVRLGRGSAMQVRLEPDASRVSFRIVPIANVKQLNGDSPWSAVSEAQIRTWMQSESPIGQWLLAKGVRPEQVEERLAGTFPAQPKDQRRALVSFQSNDSLSVL